MASTSAGVRVARAVTSACASVFVPPQASTQSGRVSALPAARRISSAPGVTLSGPTAAMPYAGWPLTTSFRRSAAAGKPSACFSRFGCTWSYASRTLRMTSGRGPVFSHVDVVATRPSTSNWFA